MRREGGQGRLPVEVAALRFDGISVERETGLTPLEYWAINRPDKPAPQADEEDEIL